MSDKTKPKMEGPPEDNEIDDLFNEVGEQTNKSADTDDAPGSVHTLASGEKKRRFMAYIPMGTWKRLQEYIDGHRYSPSASDVISEALDELLANELDE